MSNVLKHPKLTLTLPDDDFEAIIICAVRYACGRETYMPGLVQDWIIGHCSGKLTENTLQILIRDIDEQRVMEERAKLSHGSQGLFEHDLMFKLRAWCEQELKRLISGETE